MLSLPTNETLAIDMSHPSSVASRPNAAAAA